MHTGFIEACQRKKSVFVPNAVSLSPAVAVQLILARERARVRSDAEAEWSASEETNGAVKDVSCFNTKENKLDIVTSI